MTAATPNPAEFCQALIRCRSITPDEGGALNYLTEVLGSSGFSVERLKFSAPGTPDVENLFASIGLGAPHLVFAGHTDVVPPGNEAAWTHPPFAGEIADGFLYGRGAVDMKGGIACFLAAALAHGKPRGTLYLLITGDEEGPSVNGTAKVIAWARERGIRFDAVIVGEPTSKARVGDVVKIGRRGSQSGTIRVLGRQGHVAYPHLAENPIPKLITILDRLIGAELDQGNTNFEPSNLEVISVDVGNPTFNMIPAEAAARFNVRFNDQWTLATLEAWLRHEIEQAAVGARYELKLEPGSDGFLTRPGPLVDRLTAAIQAVAGIRPELTTGGGISDARFFKDACPVVELGLIGETMHRIDERVALSDLDRLTAIYRAFLDSFFAGSAQ